MILVIDDDEQLTDVLSVSLESSGYKVQTTASPEEALYILTQEEISLILLDLRLGEYNGLELLPQLREIDTEVPIFMITAHGDVDSAVGALTTGANGYIRKPFEDGAFKAQIQQAIDTYQMRKELRGTRRPNQSQNVRAIVRTRDPLMEPVIRRIEVAAQVTSSVVISGESGTGKELVARALHQCGPRHAAPFVAFNCAAIPETLLESELFGHTRGAFTDAKESKTGLFAKAHGGTLFLDEIGDAPLSIQARLLRVLQEKEVQPLGSTTPIKVDVRVLAASHRSLLDEVNHGKFRQDLYFRLHVFPIHIPPLREHPKDILFLAHLFATRIAEEMKLSFEGFTPTAEQALEQYNWPGNVRELQNRVEHALVLTSGTGAGGKIPAQRLFPEKAQTFVEIPSMPADDARAILSDTVEPFFEAKNLFEKSYLEKLLAAAKGNIAKAARLASKSRTEVYSLLRKHSLDPGTFKEP